MMYDGSEISIWKVRAVLAVFAVVVCLVLTSPVIVREVIRVLT